MPDALDALSRGQYYGTYEEGGDARAQRTAQKARPSGAHGVGPQPSRGRRQAILEKVLGLEAYRRAKLVHTYVSSKESEVDTRALIGTCLAHGKRVAVPVVTPGTRTLAHALIDSLDQLVVGPWGWHNPIPLRQFGCPQKLASTWSSYRVLPLTGAGIASAGGGGYYDRFLAQVQTIKIGLCYDELVLDCIPGEPHDVPMDMVVAATAIYQGGTA